MEYSVKIYSRIGELMQGFLPDAAGFLVSGLPSRLFYSEAILEPEVGERNAVSRTAGERGAEFRLPGDPGGMMLLPQKTRKALAAFLRDHDKEDRGGQCGIRLYSNVPPGKGLSSSSTDILCVLHVFNDFLASGCSPEALYRIAASVDPTDPCIEEDIVVFRQHSGMIHLDVLLPPMDIVYFDAEPDLEIDTEEVLRPFSPGVGRFFDWLLDKFLRAADARDYVALFDAVTHSAAYNQTVIALPRMGEWFRLAEETQSGLMVAHSGTIIGLVTRPGQGAALQQRLSAALDTPVYFEQYPPTIF